MGALVPTAGSCMLRNIMLAWSLSHFKLQFKTHGQQEKTKHSRPASDC